MKFQSLENKLGGNLSGSRLETGLTVCWWLQPLLLPIKSQHLELQKLYLWTFFKTIFAQVIVKPGLDCCARGFLVLYAVVGLLLLLLLLLPLLLLLRVLLTAAEPLRLSLTHERCVGQSWTNRQTSLRLDWHCPQFSKHQHLSTLPWNETRDGKSNNLHLWTDFLKTRRTKKRVNSLQAALSLTQRKAHDRSRRLIPSTPHWHIRAW